MKTSKPSQDTHKLTTDVDIQILSTVSHGSSSDSEHIEMLHSYKLALEILDELEQYDQKIIDDVYKKADSFKEYLTHDINHARTLYNEQYKKNDIDKFIVIQALVDFYDSYITDSTYYTKSMLNKEYHDLIINLDADSISNLLGVDEDVLL